MPSLEHNGPVAGRQKAKAKARAKEKPAGAQAEPMAKPEAYKPLDYSKFENIQDSDDEKEQQFGGHHCEECAKVARVRVHTLSWHLLTLVLALPSLHKTPYPVSAHPILPSCQCCTHSRTSVQQWPGLCIDILCYLP